MISAVLALPLALAVAAAARPAPAVSVVFQGSYVLDAHAAQGSFEATSPQCVPGVAQRESETVQWTMRFATARLPMRGSVTLAAQTVTVSGVHIWDEASARCAAYPAGHLLCRTRFTRGRPRLVLAVLRGVVTFHPQPGLLSISDGCTGQVYNEHPDCGARDAAAVTDFAFVGALRSRAPRLVEPGRTATFDVRRSRSCTRRGVRNPGEIRQYVAARYRGRFTLQD